MEWVGAVGLLVLLLASAIAVSISRTSSVDDSWLPPMLVGAELAYSEKKFISEEMGLVAKLDRAYRTQGVLMLVELKTRARQAVYVSDVIELSVQRIALQDQTGERVANEGYVAVQSSDGGPKRAFMVKLFSSSEVAALRQRHQDLQRGNAVSPRPARSTAMCQSCAHNAVCARRFGSRFPQQ